MPAHPKPPGRRRRTNSDAPSWTFLPADGRSGRVPALPGGKTMSKTARDWWATIWRSPMAVEYVAADVPGLARAAMLVDKAARGEASAAELAELRQIEDRYGLSPKSRRALMWMIESRTDGPGGSDVDGDRERRLRLIEGGKE